MERIDALIADGRTTEYAEEALNGILERIWLSAVFYRDELCMEIDTPGDLALARSLLGG